MIVSPEQKQCFGQRAFEQQALDQACWTEAAGGPLPVQASSLQLAWYLELGLAGLKLPGAEPVHIKKESADGVGRRVQLNHCTLLEIQKLEHNLTKRSHQLLLRKQHIVIMTDSRTRPCLTAEDASQNAGTMQHAWLETLYCKKMTSAESALPGRPVSPKRSSLECLGGIWLHDSGQQVLGMLHMETPQLQCPRDIVAQEH